MHPIRDPNRDHSQCRQAVGCTLWWERALPSKPAEGDGCMRNGTSRSSKRTSKMRRSTGSGFWTGDDIEQAGRHDPQRIAGGGSVEEVLAWLHREKGERRFELFVETFDHAESRELGWVAHRNLIRLAGDFVPGRLLVHNLNDQGGLTTRPAPATRSLNGHYRFGPSRARHCADAQSVRGGRRARCARAGPSTKALAA